MDIDGFDFRDEYNVPQPEMGTPVRNFVGSVSLARGFFGQKLQLGGTAKYITERLYNGSDYNNYDNVGFDVGAKLRLVNWLGLGGAMVNCATHTTKSRIRRKYERRANDIAYQYTGESGRQATP